MYFFVKGIESLLFIAVPSPKFQYRFSILPKLATDESVKSISFSSQTGNPTPQLAIGEGQVVIFCMAESLQPLVLVYEYFIG